MVQGVSGCSRDVPGAIQRASGGTRRSQARFGGSRVFSGCLRLFKVVPEGSKVFQGHFKRYRGGFQRASETLEKISVVPGMFQSVSRVRGYQRRFKEVSKISWGTMRSQWRIKWS